MADFMSSFKYYKRKVPPPDLESVILVQNADISVVRKYDSIARSGDSIFGLKSIAEWQVYELVKHPGFIIAKKIFTSTGQKYWICRCLKDFTKKPNKLNIDLHNILREDEDWWETCLRDVDINRRKVLIEKLRWVTLGYHHNWDTEVYSETHKNAMPEDLVLLCSYIGEMIGFENFKAEAAIINMYHMNSTLSGHTDSSEMDKQAPLFSFSFGQSAIFLIGGTDQSCTPTPVWLESGDVCIMSGASRLCYHGVPRITKTTDETWNIHNDVEETSPSCFDKSLIKQLDHMDFWSNFNNYVTNCRINVNVRQVLLPDQLDFNDLS